ncbi:hypothetical protein B6U74_02215 [Candidatus Bathyarchaeota archaeon ex4484_205]|nr:MAG: hypothetical protein B6U74_02215 [Candidatus Bathyarchaeota archaeon ex4484_205]
MKESGSDLVRGPFFSLECTLGECKLASAYGISVRYLVYWIGRLKEEDYKVAGGEDAYKVCWDSMHIHRWSYISTLSMNIVCLRDRSLIFHRK